MYRLKRVLAIAMGLLATLLAYSQPIRPIIKICDSSAPTGYYFFRLGGQLTILNHLGNVVYYKPTATAGFDFNLWPDGRMTYPDRNKIIVMDSSFTEIDSIECKRCETDMHEFKILPNGNYLLLGTENITRDLSSYYWKGHYGKKNTTIKAGVVQELNKNKRIVFEWHAADNFNFDEVDTFYLANSDTDIDWTHINSVEQDSDGNLLVSIRNFNEIVKVNRQTGSVIWILGGKSNQFKNNTGLFFGQHDVRRQENGNLTFFEGGSHPPQIGARAVEMQIDEQKKQTAVVWAYTYDSTMQSQRRGSVERINNGFTLISYGFVTKNDIMFNVIDNHLKPVFEVDGEEAYRVFYYPTLPWQLKQPALHAFDSLSFTCLVPCQNYTGYRWNTGDSSRIIRCEQPGPYYLSVPKGSGGYICSNPIAPFDAPNGRVGTKRKNTKRLALK